MLRFQVDGMNCGHCVQAVTRAVKSADPAAEVTVDLPTGRVEVKTARASEPIATAIREAGYATSDLA